MVQQPYLFLVFRCFRKVSGYVKSLFILRLYFLTISDQGSTYSGDLESEAVSTPHSWEEELNHYALKSNAVQEADSELKQFSKGETEQDLEADFPSGLCSVH